MNKRYWTGLLILAVALDVVLTYWQNYQLPLDGDLAPTIFPSAWYSKVMQDPFGWAVLTRNEIYAGPNRFFAHATTTLYWKQVPHLLQYFTTPINSLYTASALFNTGTHVLTLFILAAYVRLGAGVARGSWGFWLAAVLLAPLFQTDGFYEQMGITNWAITFTFFYAFPTALLLLLLWPFHQAACQQQPLRLRPWQAVLLVLLMVVVAFNGAIPIAAAAVLVLGIGVNWAWQHWKAVPRWPVRLTLTGGWLSEQALLLLGILTALSAYSLYIGRNNAENLQHTHTLWELYQLLPIGIYRELTMQWGLPLLVLLVVVNAQLIRYLLPLSNDRQRVLNALRWVGMFALVFILLLPLGGFRNYRPYVVRGDAILPVLLGLFYAYGVSTCFLFYQLRGRIRVSYVVVVGLFATTFTYADSTTKMPRNNDCERWALDQLARAPEPVVRLSPYCSVLGWDLFYDHHQSELQGEMLYYWGVTKTKKLYYQQ